MGAKNCPETPRQKMIGMMYLVLTAMLALNVSADVLDAFTKVQQGLTSTIANFTKKNADLYNDIEMAYNLNQTKVAAVREKTNEIRKSTQELVDYIEQLKYKMVVLADGEEDADVMNIKAKDNLDIGGQVMVLQGKGKELREMITAYREQLSGLIADKDSVLKNSVLTHLATDDPKPRIQVLGSLQVRRDTVGWSRYFIDDVSGRYPEYRVGCREVSFLFDGCRVVQIQ